MQYWDTSALLKLYVAEADSVFFLSLIAKTDREIASSSISTIEILCALCRKERAGDLKRGSAKAASDRFAADTKAGRILTVPYGQDVLVAAARIVEAAYRSPQPIMLRPLDAIHVASAMVIGAKTIVATDGRLRDIALLQKLRVLP